MTTRRSEPEDGPDGPGGGRPAGRGSFRDRVRSRAGVRHGWRVGVFLLGLLLILTGLALAVLPGPLTIPPVLLGLWIWSTEFHWAHRFFHPFKAKGAEAWEHAKRRPVSSAAITVGGLAVAGVAVWAAAHFHAVDRVRDLVGLG
jgi:hypothetical protein